jgi:signal transduction histidine kinase
VDVARQEDSIRITVADDGDGFDADDVSIDVSNHRGFGLFNIKERLNLIGGHLAIESQPGHGSRFTLLAHLAGGPPITSPEVHGRPSE